MDEVNQLNLLINYQKKVIDDLKIDISILKKEIKYWKDVSNKKIDKPIQRKGFCQVCNKIINWYYLVDKSPSGHTFSKKHIENYNKINNVNNVNNVNNIDVDDLNFELSDEEIHELGII